MQLDLLLCVGVSLNFVLCMAFGKRLLSQNERHIYLMLLLFIRSVHDMLCRVVSQRAQCMVLGFRFITGRTSDFLACF
jgi:hypothetical protein